MSSNLVRVVGALRNKLLAALPDKEWERVQRYLSLIQAPAGKTLGETDRELDYGYFPITSIISILHIATDRASTQIATIGNEGVVGLACSWTLARRRIELPCRAEGIFIA